MGTMIFIGKELHF